jgi:hypothetical protein
MEGSSAVTDEAISKSRTEELHMMAQGLYGTISGLTRNPFEMITVLTMMHLMLWLNTRAPGISTEDMLKDYCQNFTANCEANEERTL